VSDDPKPHDDSEAPDETVFQPSPGTPTPPAGPDGAESGDPEPPPPFAIPEDDEEEEGTVFAAGPRTPPPSPRSWHAARWH